MSLAHRSLVLVRADGLGDWVKALDDALIGPASQHISEDIREARKAFTERLSKDNWQHEAVYTLHEVLTSIHNGTQPIGDKVVLRTWFQLFSELRNKTRGHGALTPATSVKVAPKLRSSIQLLCERNPLFELPWAYLHRNLSGKYQVVHLGGKSEPFEKLKTAAAISGEQYADGVYMWSGNFRRVDLLHTDLDASDFFLPNGAFRNETYELHSLITDNRLKGDATPYMTAAGVRPPSESEGKGELEILGRVFSNLPSAPPGYVSRPQLEFEVKEALMNDRHPVVTLVGRGGIGKTSTALEILHKLTLMDRYQVIIWFSARDIDLLMSGAKSVQPHLLTDRDIAEEYQALIGGLSENEAGKVNPIELLARDMHDNSLGPILYVSDNFETVRNPIDLFQWIDMNIRLPNKAVITTRFRDFKADYPIEVPGMEYNEAKILVSQTSTLLGIDKLITADQSKQIIEESNGHPYVIKILLGEISDTTSFSKLSKLIARKEDILDALFERT